VPRAVVQRVMPIMPSEKLIQHEWSKHGTCTAFDQRKYFETLQDAFAAVRIPRDYQGPLQQIVVNPQDVKKKFVAANSGMNENTLRIQCSGRFISELRVCMTKDLKLRACPASMRDSCRGDEAILRPVR
jgi:ribonuclease T2